MNAWKAALKMLVLVVWLGMGSGLPLQAQPQQPETQTNQPAQAGPTEETQEQYEEIGGILLLFLTLSIIFEVALTPIFNWRVFLKHFEGKGVKTPLTVGLAFVVFLPYENLDIFSSVLNVFGISEESSSWGGRVVTALLIAGGSDGIFRIFKKLGIRDPNERAKKAAEARRAAAEGSS